jgi:hypothetical protein
MRTNLAIDRMLRNEADCDMPAAVAFAEAKTASAPARRST